MGKRMFCFVAHRFGYSLGKPLNRYSRLFWGVLFLFCGGIKLNYTIRFLKSLITRGV